MAFWREVLCCAQLGIYEFYLCLSDSPGLDEPRGKSSGDIARALFKAISFSENSSILGGYLHWKGDIDIFRCVHQHDAAEEPPRGRIMLHTIFIRLH